MYWLAESKYTSIEFKFKSKLSALLTPCLSSKQNSFFHNSTNAFRKMKVKTFIEIVKADFNLFTLFTHSKFPICLPQNIVYNQI